MYLEVGAILNIDWKATDCNALDQIFLWFLALRALIVGTLFPRNDILNENTFGKSYLNSSETKNRRIQEITSPPKSKKSTIH